MVLFSLILIDLATRPNSLHQPIVLFLIFITSGRTDFKINVEVECGKPTDPKQILSSVIVITFEFWGQKYGVVEIGHF